MTGDRCKNCRFSYPVDLGDGGEMLRACVYILRRGERRPCPAGDACTAFAPKERRRPLWACSDSPG